MGSYAFTRPNEWDHSPACAPMELLLALWGEDWDRLPWPVTQIGGDTAKLAIVDGVRVMALLEGDCEEARETGVPHLKGEEDGSLPCHCVPWPPPPCGRCGLIEKHDLWCPFRAATGRVGPLRGFPP